MAITTTAIIADTIPVVLEEAMFTAQHRAVMANLVWKVRKALHDGSTVNLPYWGIVTANALTEGIDMINHQAMADTLVTITPAEVGAQILITDKVARDNKEDVIRAAGRILGDAMEVKRDTDLLALIDNGTTSLGGTSTTFTLGMVAAGVALLEGNAVSTGGPAPKPYTLVHHPYSLLDIVDVLTPVLPAAGTSASAGGSVADDVLRNYIMGRLFGIPIVSDGNFTIASTAVKGGMFATGMGGAIVLATADEWDIEPERDASLRATELNVVGEYGVGNYLNGWTVELHVDATTPA